MRIAASEHNENLRQLEHLAPIAFAFLLRFLTWEQALIFAFVAVLYAAFVSPRLFRVTQRPEEQIKGYSAGKLAYAFSVFTLVLFFREDKHLAAVAWANLSVGDAASNLIGRRFGRARLPWNSNKTWLGTCSSVFFSSLAGFVLLLWTEFPPHSGNWNARRGLLYSTTTAIVCSVVETLQIPLDDNLTICLAGGTFLRGLSLARWPSNWAWDEWITGLLVSAGTGLAALSLKTLTLSGLVCGVVMGSVVYSSFGAQGFLLLATFFVLGSLFSKIGYRRKQLEGTAQPDFGRRSARHVLGKGFAPLVAGLASIFFDSKQIMNVGFTAAVATALYDTTSTELGQLLGRHTILLTSLEHVPRGTPGAVSLAGSTVGFLAAAMIGFEAVLFKLISPIGMVCILLSASFSVHLESYLAAHGRSDNGRSGQLLNAFHTTVSMLLAMLFAKVYL